MACGASLLDGAHDRLLLGISQDPSSPSFPSSIPTYSFEGWLFWGDDAGCLLQAHEALHEDM